MLPPSRWPWSPPTLVAWLATLLLLAGGLAALSGVQAADLPTTRTPGLTTCKDFTEDPLWARGVSVEPLKDAADTPERGLTWFVEASEQLEVRFDVVNRIPESCAGEAPLAGGRLDNVTAWAWDTGADRWIEVDEFDCPPGKLAVPGARCSVRDVVTVPDGSGDVHLRYLLLDEGVEREPLLGVERVLVVGQTPDLSVESMQVSSQAQTPRTADGAWGGSNPIFDLDVLNDGSYPAWAPNAGLFWGRSAFDGADEDRAPDHQGDGTQSPGRERAYGQLHPQLPPCIGDDDEPGTSPWDQTDGTTRSSDPPCSYKRGKGILTPTQVQLDALGWSHAPFNSSAHVATPNYGFDREEVLPPDTARTYVAIARDAPALSGRVRVNVSLGWGADGWGVQPEPDLANNNRSAVLDIPGPDLRVVDPQVSLWHEGEPVDCGQTVKTSCPRGTVLRISAAYENTGDLPTDGPYWPASLGSDGWNVTVRLDDERVAVNEAGDPVSREGLLVPGAGQGPSPLWSQPVDVEALEEGGRQTLRIHLDPPDDGDEVPLTRQVAGRVVETNETHTCPSDEEPLDNVFCWTIYLDDGSAPVVQDVAMVSPETGEPVDVVREGVPVRIQANVSDESLDTVQAHVSLPNGSVETLAMDPAGDGSDRWTVTQTFTGIVGPVAYEVIAEDDFGLETTADPASPLEVVEWPKTIQVDQVKLNGDDAGDGEDPPTYRGSAVEPGNDLRVDARVKQTGRQDPASTEGKLLRLFDRTGELAHELPLDAYQACGLYSTVDGSDEGQGYGEECRNDGPTSTTYADDRHTVFFVDTACDESGSSDGDELPGCQDARADARRAWSDASIDWAGTFSAEIVVEDPFGRTNVSSVALELADVDGPPTLEDGVLDPGTATPGERVVLAARAADALRVENVTAHWTKPDGTTGQTELRLPEGYVEDAATRNGTYVALVSTGRGGQLDQAGTYNVTLTALDLAGKETTLDLGSVTVEDTDKPTIASLAATPWDDKQEVGSPVSWEAHVRDATALKSASLMVVRPGAGATVHELDHAGGDHYVLEDPIEATPDNVGEWTYRLTVEDWAGHQAIASGTLDVVPNLPPRATDWAPGHEPADAERLYGGPTPTIQADLVDYGSGVNESSVRLFVKGHAVEPELEPIEAGVRVSYKVSTAEAFSDGEIITVRLAAADRTTPDPRSTSALVHQFTVDAREPTVSVSAPDALSTPNGRILGPNSPIRVDAQDLDAGPAHTTVTVEGLDPSGQGRAGTRLTLDAHGNLTPAQLPPHLASYADLRFSFVPEDAVGNRGDALTWNVSVDRAAPAISFDLGPGQEPEDVRVAIDDEAPIERARLEYTVDGETQDPIPLTEDGDRWTATIPTYDAGSTVNATATAEDVFGNAGTTSSPLVFQTGQHPPSLRLMDPEPGEVVFGRTRVQWAVSDVETPSGDLEVDLQYKEPGGTFQPLPGVGDREGNGTVFVETGSLPNGELVLQAIVTDGTTFGADEVEIQVRNLRPPFASVLLGEAEEPAGRLSADAGSTVPVHVTLETPARTAWANVTEDGRTVASTQLATEDGRTWTGEIELPERAGEFSLDLAAVTDDGRSETRGAYVVETQASGTSSVLGVSPLLVATLGALAVGVLAGAVWWRRR